MTDPAAAPPILLLIHGGRHGGWCWKRMLPALTAAGHTCLTPTLTGLGERRHLLHREIGLSTHLQDVVQIVEHEDLHDVVAVAHSYGGMVATGVADRLPERFRGVVYLDALVPHDGAAVLDLIGPDLAARMRADVEARGDGWRVPTGPDMLAQYGVHDPDDVAWALPRTADQPFATYRDPLRLTGGIDRLPRSYVWFSRSPVIPAATVDALRADPGWGFATVDAEHDAIITDPQEVAEALLAAVRGLPGRDG